MSGEPMIGRTGPYGPLLTHAPSGEVWALRSQADDLDQRVTAAHDAIGKLDAIQARQVEALHEMSGILSGAVRDIARTPLLAEQARLQRNLRTERAWLRIGVAILVVTIATDIALALNGWPWPGPLIPLGSGALAGWALGASRRTTKALADVTARLQAIDEETGA